MIKKARRYLDIFYTPQKEEVAGREWVWAIAKENKQ